MKLDFWNNPLVVSSFRLRQRRGNWRNVLVGYPMVLLLIFIAVPYFLPKIQKDWPQYAFYGLVGLQLVVSGMMAGASANSSMKAEVTKQTLDFQRISCLSPRQILLGKLLGESAMAFFLVMATFPVALLCFAMDGVSLLYLGLAYLNLFANTVLCGAAGLVTQLEMKNNKVEGGTLWPIPLILIFQGGYVLRNLGAWLPVFLLVYPLVLLLLAFLAFHVMERRLDNPLNPPIGKKAAYALLVLVDATAAGWLLYLHMTYGRRCATFITVHLLTCIMLIFNITPWKESLRSWIWRFRGRLPWRRDLLVSNRTENGLALVVFSLIGLVGLAAVAGGATFVDEFAEVVEEGSVPWRAAVLSVMLVLTLGTCYQWFMLIFGKGGGGVFVLTISLLIFLPHIVAQAISSWLRVGGPSGNLHELGRFPILDWLFMLSPSAHFWQWYVRPSEPYNVIPITILYCVLLAFVWLSLRRRMRVQEQVVDRKLEKMGALQKVTIAAPPASAG